MVILTLLTIIFFFGFVSSCFNGYQQKKVITKEMEKRLDLEDAMNRFDKEKESIENKANSAVKALEEEKQAHQATKKVLADEKAINSSLKESLDKANKIKEALEEDLKEALISSKRLKR
ncbi:hypothetical protein EPO66_02070 [bacterium]|nr:MAG: hypothetical protein EPO66_02070 [bacterium]